MERDHGGVECSCGGECFFAWQIEFKSSSKMSMKTDLYNVFFDYINHVCMQIYIYIIYIIHVYVCTINLYCTMNHLHESVIDHSQVISILNWFKPLYCPFLLTILKSTDPHLPPAVLTTVLTETSAPSPKRRPSIRPPDLDQQRQIDVVALTANASATIFAIYHVRDRCINVYIYIKYKYAKRPNH